MRVQVSPGAFSQCVGIRKTRLTQNQLLKKRASSNLVTAIYVHMAELADAHDLGSCAERRESSRTKRIDKKKEVSDTLTKMLKTKQLKRRQCPDCGRALQYNYQYGICESCYSMRNRRYGYWGDEWF